MNLVMDMKQRSLFEDDFPTDFGNRAIEDIISSGVGNA